IDAANGVRIGVKSELDAVLSIADRVAGAVGDGGGASRIGADVVADNAISLGGIIGTAGDTDAAPVAGNDIASAARRAADGVIAAVHRDADTVGDRDRPVGAEADVVSQNGAEITNAYAGIGVAGNDVSFAWVCAADGDVGPTNAVPIGSCKHA